MALPRPRVLAPKSHPRSSTNNEEGRMPMSRNPLDLTNIHVFILARGELRIAVLEAMEDLLRPVVEWLARHLPRRPIGSKPPKPA